MALAALIAATKEVDGPATGLRATMPVAGQCLVEHQARLAARAGARHIVILVATLPPALMAAIDRLKRDGLGVEIARDLADAVDRIHPEERLLLFADGFVTGAGLIERMASMRGPAILVVPDEPATQGFERIDAGDRWAGLLLVDGNRLRQTASILGEWDLESTVLRQAVQEGAERIRPESHDHIVVATSPNTLAGIDGALFAASRLGATDWPGEWIFPGIEHLVVPPLLENGTDAAIPGWVAAGCAVAGGLALLWGLWLPGFLLLLLSGPAAAIARRMAAARLAESPIDHLVQQIRLGGATVGVIGLCQGLVAREGWGLWGVGALLILGIAATTTERRIVTLLPGPIPSRWIASLDGILWGMLPFALLAEWSSGLLAMAIYAVGSFLLLQREAAGRVASLVDQP